MTEGVKEVGVSIKWQVGKEGGKGTGRKTFTWSCPDCSEWASSPGKSCQSRCWPSCETAITRGDEEKMFANDCLEERNKDS